MLVTTKSCRRCHRINLGRARFCSMCGARLRDGACGAPCGTSPLRGLVWAVIITFLFVLFFKAVVLHPTPRRFRLERSIYPGHRVMLDSSCVHQHADGRHIDGRMVHVAH